MGDDVKFPWDGDRASFMHSVWAISSAYRFDCQAPFIEQELLQMEGGRAGGIIGAKVTVALT